MDVDLNELERLARAASEGPWEWHAPTDVLDDDLGRFTSPAGEVCGFGVAGPTYDCVCGNPPSDNDAAFIAAANPQTVLALIQMVRSAYSRALRDVREGMQVAREEGLEPDCGYGCAARGYAFGVPGCPVHDPTALPQERDRMTMGSGS